jgi:DNA primase
VRNVNLTPQLIQAVRDAVDVATIAGEHTRLAKRGRRWVGLCPLHKEKTPSFSVDPVHGLFYCFGCGAGGDAIKLHMLLTGDDFPSAIEELARRHGIPLPTRSERRDPGRQAPETQAALEAAQEFFTRALSRAPAPRDYLARRRIPAELGERFGLGYAPEGWRELIEALHPKIPLAELAAAGLVVEPEGGGRPYDRFRNRLMFPIHSAAGRLVGFGGRTLGDDAAKYVNSSETEQFHKGRLLYALHHARRALREGGRALLVEGYFDVLAAVASGVEWTVASMGTALTPEQAGLLGRYVDEVVVGYDGDEAGETAFRRALPLLLGEGLAVMRARFGAGHDPDSLRLEAGPEAVAEAVEEAADGVLAEIERLLPPPADSGPHSRARAASRIAELLGPIPDSIVRLGYGRLAAERLGIPADLLWRRPAAGGTPRRPAPQEAPPAATAGPRQVRSLEEQVLAMLLSGDEEVPPAAELPAPETFLDPVCRNIYRTFCALYGREGEVPPPGAVPAALTADGSAVDRVAQLLLEGPVAPSKAGLPALFGALRRRWERQRLRELAREIGEAQRQGDSVRCERLVDEKTTLSLRYHRGLQHDPRPGDG